MKNSQKKNPAAVLLGRLGGSVVNKKKSEASRRNLAKARSVLFSKKPSSALPMRRTSKGGYQYEVSPGRWVSRQRVEQMNNPEAHAARQKAQRLIATQPCEKCGTTRNVDRHHDDYGQPLNVQWLCQKHHNEADKARRERNQK